jgi:DNA-binding NarL/FixJ family response regulator
VRISFTILEDNQEIRQGFELFLKLTPDFTCIGSFDNPSDFLNSFSRLQPDVAIVDIHLPGMSGIECILRLKPQFPATQFLICTVYEDDEQIFNAFCAGATGYILKKESPEDIVQAIRDVHMGGSPMSMQVSRKVVASFQKRSVILNQQQVLTLREKELLEFLSKGLRYKEIAFHLNLSIETVRTHIRNIYIKLQVQSRTEALNKAYPKHI